MAEELNFSFKTYAWSLGTTTFRMADFHRKVEEQLILLNDFWKLDEYKDAQWDKDIQEKYYDFIYSKGFVSGNINDDKDKKSKTARQKTSGLVDIGLIDSNRRLTDAGKYLLELAVSNNFLPRNPFRIPEDSFVYFKQLLKTSSAIDDGYVRPYLVTGQILSECDDYLTDDEFTYFLPLCVDRKSTEQIIENIRLYRENRKSVDQVIGETVLKKQNYVDALQYFLLSEKSDNDILSIGMNRDGKSHDRAYVELFRQLKNVYVKKQKRSINDLYNAAKKITGKAGTYWRKYLFKNPRRHEQFSDLNDDSMFSCAKTEESFAEAFFTQLHIGKIKATLLDYKDLNRRYLKTTDTVLFHDGKVEFAPIFKYFFKTDAKRAFGDAFKSCRRLSENCSLKDIHPALVFSEKNVVSTFNSEEGTHFSSAEEMYDNIEDGRYTKFRTLIDRKFPSDIILKMLDDFKTRKNDAAVIKECGGEADVPTIFEYIVGIAWYRLSGYKGKILDYMNLSLNSDLLPRTHAGGGMSDIEYLYPATKDYPEHALLIECTLMEGTTQRHGEMEPVSRHLSNYMIDRTRNAYCAFISNNLHASLISDFKMRRFEPYYRNDTEHVDGMEIIPVHVDDLSGIIKKKVSYNELYKIFDSAYHDRTVYAPPEWYKKCIKKEIEKV